MIKENRIIGERYRVIGSVGHGGMSDVFEARDMIFKRNVAIKILKSEFAQNIENLIRFQNEARISSCLNSSLIVKIYDYGEFEGLPYIVNEFVKDQTLRDILDFKRYLSLEECCSLMIQILDAVSYLHSKKIIHRDLKPLNIFCIRDGSIKIADFGISIIQGASINISENKKVMGTVQYLAPEVIKGHKPSFQSDIYALGITFYEMLTGKVPFNSTNPTEVAKMVTSEEVPSVLKLMPKLLKDIDLIVKKATAKKLDERYKTCEEFKKDVLSIYQNKKIIRKNKSLFSRIFGLSDE